MFDVDLCVSDKSILLIILQRSITRGFRWTMLFVLQLRHVLVDYLERHTGKLICFSFFIFATVEYDDYYWLSIKNLYHVSRRISWKISFIRSLLNMTNIIEKKQRCHHLMYVFLSSYRLTDRRSFFPLKSYFDDRWWKNPIFILSVSLVKILFNSINMILIMNRIITSLGFAVSILRF